MDRYSLISTPLPFEIQNKIIVIAEFIWYNDKVNMIINNWYRYLSRKITMYRISTTLKKYYIETEGSLIDPMCEINKKKSNIYINILQVIQKIYFIGKNY